MMNAGDFEAAKQKLLSRKRRVIFNNDGCDIFIKPRDSGSLEEEFLSLRTRPLAETHVDVISYCTISSGFGLFTHRTEVGEILTREHPRLRGNIAPDFIAKGTDCLEVVADFCRGHGMEVFWCMRMNDTHDGAHRAEAPYFLFPELKRRHPEYLLGAPDEPLLYGKWSGVDYDRAEIRELAYLFVEEAASRYDLDGIELDFFRHPVFFKQAAEGRPAGDAQRRRMTDLIRRISVMLRYEGRKRGRPFLLAVRTPDDAAYCNTIGLEIEKWMGEGLIDIYIPSGYFRLNSWDYSVRLGHKYGVGVYPGLSESRVGGGHHADAPRASDECYRARAMNAWNAGADGVYVFNLFDPGRRIWKEIGDPDKLRTLDKIYFASCRGIGRAAGGSYPHEHFIGIPVLNPGAPIPIQPGSRAAARIEIGEKFPSGAGDGAIVRLFVRILPEDAGAEKLTVSFNGHEPAGDMTGLERGFVLKPDFIRKGMNVLEVVYGGKRTDMLLADARVLVNYSGSSGEDFVCVERTRAMM